MKLQGVRRWGVAGALTGVLALGGCGTMGHEQTWTMNTTEMIPSAVGKVKVEVAHLAQPSAVFDQTSTYVVWLKPESGTAQNVGVLSLNKDLKGSLETQTAFKDFQVIVTAEKDANVTSPSGRSVMNASVVVPS